MNNCSVTPYQLTFAIGLINTVFALSQSYFLTLFTSLDCKCASFWLPLTIVYTYISIIACVWIVFLCSSGTYHCFSQTKAFGYITYALYALTGLYFVTSFLTIKRIISADCQCISKSNFILAIQVYERAKTMIASLGMLFVATVVVMGFILYHSSK